MMEWWSDGKERIELRMDANGRERGEGMREGEEGEKVKGERERRLEERRDFNYE